MSSDWLIRVGDGSNFKNSSKFYIWDISSNNRNNKYFLENVKEGDKLWFIKSKNNGKVLAVSTYVSCNRRVFGELLDLSLTNNELGWNNTCSVIDTEIFYKNLYCVENCNLFTNIKSPCSIRIFNEKCAINLPHEYYNIVRYCNITLAF